MYIENGVYTEIKLDAGTTFPVVEGSLVNVANGIGTVVPASDTSGAQGAIWGIIPQTIDSFPPGGYIRLAIGGTVNMLDEANKHVDFTGLPEILEGDINFIPYIPSASDGGLA